MNDERMVGESRKVHENKTCVWGHKNLTIDENWLDAWMDHSKEPALSLSKGAFVRMFPISIDRQKAARAPPAMKSYALPPGKMGIRIYLSSPKDRMMKQGFGCYVNIDSFRLQTWRLEVSGKAGSSPRTDKFLLKE